MAHAALIKAEKIDVVPVAKALHDAQAGRVQRVQLLHDAQFVDKAPKARGVDLPALQPQRVLGISQPPHFLKACVDHCNPSALYLDASDRFRPVDGGGEGHGQPLFVVDLPCDTSKLGV
jgi:hypothetical protein